MQTATMHYLDTRGNVLFVRENVTESERLRIINDPRWVTAYWTEWSKK